MQSGYVSKATSFCDLGGGGQLKAVSLSIETVYRKKSTGSLYIDALYIDGGMGKGLTLYRMATTVSSGIFLEHPEQTSYFCN